MDYELYTARKYGLFWSNACIEDEDQDNEPAIDGLYIYQPERYSEPFFQVFDKLRQLNDYCFNQLIAAEVKLLELAAHKQRATARKDGYAEELCYLDDQIPMWEDNVAVVAKAVPIVLLCSFVEWGLKRLTQEFCLNKPTKPPRSISQFEFLLGHLRHNGQLRFSVSSDLVAIIDSFRKVRNEFAHGHWQSLSQQLTTISLRTCFEAISQLFEQIEVSAWQSPWGRAAR